jgi:actin-related protein 6
MMDEFYLVNDVKEQLCYVSMNPRKETKMANLVKEGKRWFDREYVLPDFVQTFSGSVRLPAALLREQMLKDKEVQKSSIHNDEGRVKSGATQVLNGKVNTVQNDCDEHIQDKSDENDSDSENESEEHARQRILKQREEERKRRELEEQERQVLSVSTERFSVPEIMFHPKDVGLDQVSLSEGIHQAIQACDNIHRGAMYNNIVLTGGNIKMLYLRDRVEKEVRSLAPDQYDVRVFLPDDPVTYAWRGAQDYICSSGFMCNGSVDRFDWERLKEENKSVDEIWGDSNLPEGLVTI